MHFSVGFVALVATTLMPFLASAIQLTNSAFNNINSGQQFTLTWTGDGTPVYIDLDSGTQGSNNRVANLGKDITGTSTTVTIPNVASGTYTIKIKQSGQTSYSSPFTISGTGAATTQCNECNDNNNNNGYNGYPMETYVSTYVSVFGTTTSTYTTTTTGPCTTGTNYPAGYTTSCVPNVNQVINGVTYASSCTTYNGGYPTNYPAAYTTSCIPNVNQVINGVTYASSCTTYNGGYPATTCNQGFTSVVNGVTYQPTCTNGVQVVNGVTQINDGQVQANGGVPTTAIFTGTATTLPLTGTYTTATGTATGVQSFFGAAPKVAVSAGAAIIAGGLAVVMAL